MFSYYGSKSKIAHLYPAPVHDMIIEPFAGSARYSLLHWEKEVRLYDANPLVVELWQYLLAASPADILGLPDIASKVHIDTFTQLAPIEKTLIGFHLCRGKAKPRKVGHGQNNWSRDRERIASELFKIRHWSITLSEYYHVPNLIATHFIDPPYQMRNIARNGDRYPQGRDINYPSLGQWIRSRCGQVIACEGDGTDYLPFKLLKTVTANTNNKSAKRNGEYVYVQEAPCQ